MCYWRKNWFMLFNSTMPGPGSTLGPTLVPCTPVQVGTGDGVDKRATWLVGDQVRVTALYSRYRVQDGARQVPLEAKLTFFVKITNSTFPGAGSQGVQG